MPMRSLTHRERRSIMTRGLVRKLASKLKHRSFARRGVLLTSVLRKSISEPVSTRPFGEASHLQRDGSAAQRMSAAPHSRRITSLRA
jgi:hypothetical protein